MNKSLAFNITYNTKSFISINLTKKQALNISDGHAVAINDLKRAIRRSLESIEQQGK